MTEILVIDASFAVSILLPHPSQDKNLILFRQWIRDGVIFCAPHLWVYEVTSAISKMVHFRRVEPERGKKALLFLKSSRVRLFPSTDDQIDRAFYWTQRLNRAAAYDSFYLALAESLACELWTADQKLVNAANEDWVKLAA